MKTKNLKMWICLLVAIGPAYSSLASEKPNSKIKGVQIGTITYSYRSLPDQSLTAILDYTVRSGISSVELMGGCVEEYAGIPKGQGAEAIRQWRTAVSMDKFKEIKKLFNDKGVKIHILKLGDANWSDEEIDYAFRACKAVGAKGITTEVSEQAAKRLSPFADKHKLYVILHNHGQPGKPDFSFDKMLACGPRVMLNFDEGHYFGATGIHPNELIKRLHNRIFSIHFKDKTSKTAVDPDKNRPFGEGDTPVGEILQLIQKEKWPIYCDIELEYAYPETSDAVTEVIKCLNFCKNALMNGK
jgi:sugar phosphate isomerase/epimerase